MGRQKTKARKVLRLRQLRRSREMTQADLAKRVGLHLSTISGIEKGTTQPSFKTAVDIAAVFGEPAEQVFSYVEVPA